MSSKIFGLSEAAKLEETMRMSGWTADDFKHLCETDRLLKLLPLLRDEAELHFLKHVVDGDMNIKDKDEFLDEKYQLLDLYSKVFWSYEVVRHTRCGKIEWNAAKITLKQMKNQKEGVTINGVKLCNELKNINGLNINFLFYLLQYPGIFPDSWPENQRIYFPGTVFQTKKDSQQKKKQKYRCMASVEKHGGKLHASIDPLYFNPGDELNLAVLVPQ